MNIILFKPQLQKSSNDFCAKLYYLNFNSKSFQKLFAMLSLMATVSVYMENPTQISRKKIKKRDFKIEK